MHQNPGISNMLQQCMSYVHAQNLSASTSNCFIAKLVAGVLAGVTDLPAELSRCFLLIQELDQKSKTLQTQIEDRCRKHVLDHTAEYEVCMAVMWFLSLQVYSTCTYKACFLRCMVSSCPMKLT